MALAQLYSIDPDKLIALWLADQVAHLVESEPQVEQAIRRVWPQYDVLKHVIFSLCL